MTETKDETLIQALEILSQDIQSDDGVANACIAEAAQRLRELVEGQGQSIRVPKGYALVPIDPTQGFSSMAQAGAVELWEQCRGGVFGHPQATSIYKAMLAAAPEYKRGM